MASKIAPQMFRAFRAAPRATPWAVPRAPAFRRCFAAQAQEQPRLRLGSTGMDIRVYATTNADVNSPQLQGLDHTGRY
jgi:peroxiredoxin (alkyl hydroperoxide reductase subunit C)